MVDIELSRENVLSHDNLHIIDIPNEKTSDDPPASATNYSTVEAWYNEACGEVEDSPVSDPPAEVSGPPVGIVGAGCAGLYAGLILDSLDIKYEILEADSRVGGRVKTYRFSQKADEPNGTHDYYWYRSLTTCRCRFPETKQMDRLFKLFKYDKLNSNGISVEAKRIPYHFDTKDGNGIQYFNGNRKRMNAGYEKIYRDVIDPFARGLEDDLYNGGHAGWDRMLEFDSYSTRSYMSHVYRPSSELVDIGLPPGKPLPTHVVSWLETQSMTTGWYDRAFTDTVLGELSFGYSTDRSKPKPKFWCFDGGSEVLTNAMSDYLEKTHPGSILRSHRVAAITIKSPHSGSFSPLDVTYFANGNKTTRTYSHVIATPPTTVLRHAIDLSGAELTPTQSDALRRACTFTPATKIAMKFKSPWWTAGRDASGKPVVDREGNTINIIGGRSFTDRPIRVVVYPSYGLDNAGPAVLICSFVWTEDAARIGAMIGSGDPVVDEQLKELVLRDLSDLHNIELEVLQDQYIAMHGIDWGGNPSTMGAFALFGPGKFGSVYSSLTLPAARGRLHFAGEAISFRHGWIVGALDSTWRAIHEYLTVSHPDKLPEFLRKWGVNDDYNVASSVSIAPSPKKRSFDTSYVSFAPSIISQTPSRTESAKIRVKSQLKRLRTQLRYWHGSAQ
ncbi:hypothetical protein PLICRDRAFT_148036 [Plicaturopsis crispa FD-325 SS-3]|uniref:Amine oxidase domain-containing protein n=1 Tax=Plicaturopsis crispa FD-325 SS-3 TaxID=944288 RepID=A0A0C9T309_PLICR|nr:hypothetical protein PLICRDRAFT_148036 [Plicaturopsis crispa FD-325 SS-3]